MLLVAVPVAAAPDVAEVTYKNTAICTFKLLSESGALS